MTASNCEKVIDLMIDKLEMLKDQICEQQAEIERMKNNVKPSNVFELPCRIGDPVWFVYENDDNDGELEISQNLVTNVSVLGLYVSAFDPPADDVQIFVPYEDVGREAFYNRAEAEEYVRKMKGGAD